MSARQTDLVPTVPAPCGCRASGIDGFVYPCHTHNVVRLRAENAALVDEVNRLRVLLGRALPWIDPNDRHEDYLLTVEIREALGEGT